MLWYEFPLPGTVQLLRNRGMHIGMTADERAVPASVAAVELLIYQYLYPCRYVCLKQSTVRKEK